MSYSSTTVSVGDPTEKADYDRLMDNTIYLKDGATEFTGEKTFKSATVFESTIDITDAGRKISNVGVSGTTTVLVIKEKILEIGDWDMSSDSFVQIVHGVTFSNIRSVTAIIRNDADDKYYKSGHANSVSGESEFWVDEIYATIDLVRRISGEFYDAAFSSTSYNRGWVLIEYLE